MSIVHWVDDGLMAVFFLLIGLEIERELYVGKLSDPREATLPAIAALGGMVLPALIHYLFNQGTPTQAGIGIPMATDIAFALGVLALLGDRVPVSLKIFLAAFAIIDDLGAIVLIALFYAQGFSQPYFASALIIFLGLLTLNRLGVNRLSPYLIAGAVMWYCLLKSGVHATLAGVLLAFAIPFGPDEENSPSHTLLHFLHKPVAFLIMPLFALANTGIVLGGNWLGGLATASSAGIFGGLLVGKPLGLPFFPTWRSPSRFRGCPRTSAGNISSGLACSAASASLCRFSSRSWRSAIPPPSKAPKLQCCSVRLQLDRPDSGYCEGLAPASDA